MDEAALRNLPIDIQLSKLRDWLVDRKWVSKDFYKVTEEVRAELPSLLSLLPQDIKQNLPSAENLSYYDFCEIVNSLEAWTKIISKLKANNVYLGDSAVLLVRDVNFEGPSLKKQQDRARKRLQDLANKELDYIAIEKAHRQQFASACQQLGFEATELDDMEEKISSIQHRLQPFVNEALADIQSLEFQAAVTYYREFLAFTLDEVPIEILPLVNFISRKGDAAVHTFLTGEDVEVVNETNTNLLSKMAKTKIDFGDANQEPKIDFGDADQEPKIDFGD
eukprot:gene1189-4403_t